MPNRYVYSRDWYSALVRRDPDATRLIPERGRRHTTIVRATGQQIVDVREESASLVCAAGDRFLLCGPALEDTLAIEVLAVDLFGTLTVRFFGGELSSSCDRVQLTALHRFDLPVVAKSRRRKVTSPEVEVTP